MTERPELKPNLKPVQLYPERLDPIITELPKAEYAGVTFYFDTNLGSVGLLELDAARTPSEFTKHVLPFKDYQHSPEKALIFFDNKGTPRIVFIMGAFQWGDCTPYPYFEARRFDISKHDPNLYIVSSYSGKLHPFEDLGTPNKEHDGLRLDSLIPSKIGNTVTRSFYGTVIVRSLDENRIAIQAIDADSELGNWLYFLGQEKKKTP
jgi:hypothetical protein